MFPLPLLLITIFAISLNIEPPEPFHPVAFNRVLCYMMYGTGWILALDIAWFIHTIAPTVDDELPFCILTALPWRRLNFKFIHAWHHRGLNWFAVCILDKDERSLYSFDMEF
jgi:hypothetical protein